MNLERRKLLWKKVEVSGPLLFLVSYLVAITIGTILLSLPVASRPGQSISVLDAFFVSTSALCVTGLTPVVTLAQWSIFGQVVILILIQIGGLGIMTAAAAFGLLANVRFGLGTRKILMEERNQDQVSGIVALVLFILKATFLIEGVGAVILSLAFIPHFGILGGIWQGIFTSISSFCNAGFDILGSSSLEAWSGNSLVLVVTSLLLIVAGLGFTVQLNFLGFSKGKRLNLHAKIVLFMTALLLGVGTVLIFLGERGNPQTLGAMPLGQAWLNAFYQSASSRTCGFASFDQGLMTHAGAMTTILLMFIGGSPAGTAGGIKTTTMAALIHGTRMRARDASQFPIFKRNLPDRVIRRAGIIFISSLLWCMAIILILTFTEIGQPFLDIVYETISAFGTVGLTRGLTSALTPIGKLLIAATMLFGKLGPMTIIFALLPGKKVDRHRAAEESILVG